ncbi:MAG TPA: hypothetical protein VI757_03195 [Bacteroidia bacterium]|nr:hypothetical protein [Bacteroidia bacterium]
MKATIRTKQLRSVIRMKDEIIHDKVRRIDLLEHKLEQLRHRYFELKYHDVTIDRPGLYFIH